LAKEELPVLVQQKREMCTAEMCTAGVCNCDPRGHHPHIEGKERTSMQTIDMQRLTLEQPSSAELLQKVPHSLSAQARFPLRLLLTLQLRLQLLSTVTACLLLAEGPQMVHR
jgi:hypothetical protein